MIQRSVGVAALGFIAALCFTAVVVAAKPAVMVEYRVAKVAPESLEALGLTHPAAEAGTVEIGSPRGERFAFDIDLAGLEASKKAHIVSRPMIMVQQGEKTGIDSSGPNGDFKLTMRVEAQGDGFVLDLAIELSGGGVEPIAFQRDGIALPASLVRCPEEGECLVVLAHATMQAAEAPRSPDAR